MGRLGILAHELFDGERVLFERGVLISEGRIEAVLPRAEFSDEVERIEVARATAGWIDLQVNGGGDLLFNNETSAEAISKIARAHRRFGTTRLLVTLITDRPEKMEEAFRAVAAAMEVAGCGCLGLHLEGPFLNPEKKGAHPARFIRRPAEEEVVRILEQEGRVRLITLAPEWAGGEAMERLSGAGIVLFAGHTAGRARDYREAEPWLRGFTHLYNAMSPLGSREPGAVGAALDRPEWFCSVIADGIHVDPASLRLAWRAKREGPGRLFLVTDAMSTVGGSLDHCTLLGERLELVDGQLLTGDGVLAGAHLSMEQAVAGAVRFLGIDWAEAFRMASLYPAEVLGIAGEYGRVRAGWRADLTLLDEANRVVGTVVDGVYASAGRE